MVALGHAFCPEHLGAGRGPPVGVLASSSRRPQVPQGGFSSPVCIAALLGVRPGQPLPAPRLHGSWGADPGTPLLPGVLLLLCPPAGAPPPAAPSRGLPWGSAVASLALSLPQI